MSNSGLYDDLADTESLADDTTPSDGYFNPRRPYQNTLVQDPSLPSPEEIKTREAREEEEANRAGGYRDGHAHASHYTPPSTQRQQLIAYDERLYSDRSPLIPTAPPAYEAATAGNHYRLPESGFTPGNGGNDYGYQTIPRTYFGTQGGPQSMGGPTENEDSDSVSRRFLRPLKRLRSYCSVGVMGKTRFILQILLVLLAIGVGIGFVADVVSTLHSKKEMKAPHVQFPSDETTCSANAYPKNFHFRLNSRSDGEGNLRIWQMSSDPDNEREGTFQEVRIIGEIRVNRQLEKADNNDTWIDIDSSTSDPELFPLSNLEVEDDRVIIKTPRRVWNWKSSSACISIIVTILIPPTTRYNALDIETENLDITFSPTAKVAVEELMIESFQGSVVMPAEGTEIDSRRTVVDLDTGSIKGSFSLFDLLLLKTNSGAVKVDVKPHEVNPRDPQPANLTVNTMTGKANVSFPIRNANNYKIPKRDYRVNMESRSGAISGTLLHGSSTTLISGSGSITAIVYPIGHPSNKSVISTESVNGNTHLTIMPSLTKPDYPLRRLFSNHRVSTGSLDLRYPDTWEGDIVGKYLAGSIHVNFGDTRIVHDGMKARSWHDFKAVKGKGWGVMGFEAVSGSVNIKTSPESEDQ